MLFAGLTWTETRGLCCPDLVHRYGSGYIYRSAPLRNPCDERTGVTFSYQLLLGVHHGAKTNPSYNFFLDDSKAAHPPNVLGI